MASDETYRPVKQPIAAQQQPGTTKQTKIKLEAGFKTADRQEDKRPTTGQGPRLLSHDASAQPLTQLGQRVLHLEVVLVESQHPLGDVQGVVPGAAGDGVRPGVQADLGEVRGHRSEVRGQEKKHFFKIVQ